MLLFGSCTRTEFHGKDKDMMEAAKVLAQAVNNYHFETLEWPHSLRAAEAHLPPGEKWPVNPYNGKPIKDTGSPDFDKASSTGMVYYEKVVRDDGKLVNYQLHVFGENGKLYIVGNSALGVKE